jgi:hypothetical protein
MNDVHGTILFESDNIRITTRKVLIGLKTYDIADVKSVSMAEKNLSPAAGRTLVITSLLALVIGILSCLAALSIPFIRMMEEFSGLPPINVHFLFAVLGLLFIYLGSIGRESENPTYTVQIETASGRSRILASKDKALIQKVIRAMDQALARRQENG